MTGGNYSPIVWTPLLGRTETIGEQTGNHRDIVPALSHGRQQPNAFGHCRENPRLFKQPLQHKNRPPIFKAATTNLMKAYFDPLSFDIGHIFWHKDKANKDGSYRKVRSERCEALTTRIGHCIIHHVNLATMTLGYFNKHLKSFVYYDYEYIEKVTGCSYSAVERTMRHLIKLGYIEVSQRKEKQPDGSWKSLSPIIKINSRFFLDLNIDQKIIAFYVEQSKKDLEKEKQKAEQKQKPKLFNPIPRQPRKLCFQSSEKTRSLSEIMNNLSKVFNTS